MTVIELSGVAVSVPSVGQRRPLMNDVNLRVSSGESVAIRGRSGSGKSTLLALLGLMSRPDSGEFVLSGIDVTATTDAEAARMRNEHLGFVFQSYSLIERLSVRDNVRLPLSYGRGRVSTREQRERAEALLAQVGLAGRGAEKPTRLSGGEQQRVAIARALIRRPRVILADEPTGALDTETGADIMALLSHRAAETGTCVIVVTHDADVADRMERQFVLEDGTLRENGLGT